MATTGKAYLGDSVYVDFDGVALWLTTEDGISETNRIGLEPAVYRALTEYVARLPERAGLAASLPERPIPEAEDLR
jgi:hypothetical protein